MKKKTDVKKKRCRNLEWATAHSGVESRYNALYRDWQGQETSLGAAWGPRHGQAGAQQGLQYGHSSGHDTAERGHDTADSDTKHCIVIGARV